MAAPKTKAQIKTLINDYIADGSPNILAIQHREIETAILDRVDARILATGTFTKTPLNGFMTQQLVFSPPLSTSNYIVNITAVKSPSHRATFAITNRVAGGCTIQIYSSDIGNYNARFWYAVINKNPL